MTKQKLYNLLTKHFELSAAITEQKISNKTHIFLVYIQNTAEIPRVKTFINKNVKRDHGQIIYVL